MPSVGDNQTRDPTEGTKDREHGWDSHGYIKYPSSLLLKLVFLSRADYYRFARNPARIPAITGYRYVQARRLR
jgi:hypothetical protein